MMGRYLWAAALWAAMTGGAAATVVEPSLGVSATESRVGGGVSYSDPSYPLGFHVLSGTGTPGTNVVNYDPAGYFGPTASAVSAYDKAISGNGTNPTYATGSAAADLASGQMHLVAQTQELGTGNDTSLAAIAAGTTMSDVITVTGAITGSVTVRLSMVVDGGFSGTGNDSKNAIGAFELIAGGDNAELFLNQLEGAQIQEQNVSGNGGHVITDAGNAASLQFTLYDDVVVTDTTRTISLEAFADVSLISPDGPGAITAGFGDTAQLGVSLPAGLGFTSQSGVFLTAAPSAGGTTSVPEPASLLLVGSGLLGLHLARHRRG